MNITCQLSGNRMRTYNIDEKFNRELTKYKIKCKCGHSVLVVKDKNICSWCGRFIFKDKKAEFKYRVGRKLGGD